MPVVTTLLHLRNKGHQLHVFLEYSEFCDSLGLCETFIDMSQIYTYTLPIDNKSKTVERDHFNIHNSEQSSCNYILSKHIHCDLIISFELNGLVIGSLLKKIVKCKLIYFSLEIIDNTSELKHKEIFFCRKCDCIFTQDSTRADVLSRLNCYPRKKIYIVYNNSIGKIETKRSNYLRNKYFINENKVILLISGTLMKSHGIYEMFKLIELNRHEIAFVFHGWFPYNIDRETFMMIKRKYPDIVFYSDKLFSYEEKFKLHMSSDIGLIYYEPRDVNYINAAWSSGKFFDFMRCGKPVICKKMKGSNELVINNKCGLVYKDKNEFYDKVIQIFNNKQLYTQKCHEVFLKYSFEKSFDEALARVINF